MGPRPSSGMASRRLRRVIVFLIAASGPLSLYYAVSPRDGDYGCAGVEPNPTQTKP